MLGLGQSNGVVMKITRDNDGGFIIKLNEIEAGQLRCALFRYSRGIPAVAPKTGQNLLDVLLDVHMPQYEAAYPGWSEGVI